MDVAIIDVPWNGIGESVKIASMADAYEVNVAPHNFYSHLATMMSAHFAAVVPNLRIMEFDPETVAWQDDLVTRPPRIEDRPPPAADGPRLGHRGRRGGRPGASAPDGLARVSARLTPRGTAQHKAAVPDGATSRPDPSADAKKSLTRSTTA